MSANEQKTAQEFDNGSVSSSEPRFRTLAEVQREHVLLVLAALHWDKVAASVALEISEGALRRWLNSWGVKNRKRRSDAKRAPRPSRPRAERISLAERAAKRRARAEEMAALYREGVTLSEIGSRYGLTRERVRQLMTRELGITRINGGAHVQAIRSAEEYFDNLDARCRAKNGMGRAEYNVTRKILGANGKTAREAFSMQRRNMIHNRGYEWKLTFAQWWAVWEESGKWAERGRGEGGYWLVRKNNAGAYEDGNVEVKSGGEFVAFVRAQERAVRLAESQTVQ